MGGGCGIRGKKYLQFQLDTASFVWEGQAGVVIIKGFFGGSLGLHTITYDDLTLKTKGQLL